MIFIEPNAKKTGGYNVQSKEQETPLIAVSVDSIVKK
jgi:hypothetical protein